MGEPLELTFLEEYRGENCGFWCCRFYSNELNKPVTMILRADSVASVKPEELSRLRALEDQIGSWEREFLKGTRIVERLRGSLGLQD